MCTNDAVVQVDLEATLALLNCWRDDGYVELLRLFGRAWEDIMTTLLAFARLLPERPMPSLFTLPPPIMMTLPAANFA